MPKRRSEQQLERASLLCLVAEEENLQQQPPHNLDDNGDLDVSVGNSYAANEVHINEGRRTFAALTSTPLSAGSADTTFQALGNLEEEDEDEDGVIDQTLRQAMIEFESARRTVARMMIDSPLQWPSSYAGRVDARPASPPPQVGSVLPPFAPSAGPSPQGRSTAISFPHLQDAAPLPLSPSHASRSAPRLSIVAAGRPTINWCDEPPDSDSSDMYE